MTAHNTSMLHFLVIIRRWYGVYLDEATAVICPHYRPLFWSWFQLMLSFCRTEKRIIDVDETSTPDMKAFGVKKQHMDIENPTIALVLIPFVYRPITIINGIMTNVRIIFIRPPSSTRWFVVKLIYVSNFMTNMI